MSRNKKSDSLTMLQAKAEESFSRQDRAQNPWEGEVRLRREDCGECGRLQKMAGGGGSRNL